MDWPLRYGIFDHQLDTLIRLDCINFVVSQRLARHFYPRRVWVATAVVSDLDAFMVDEDLARQYLQQTTPLPAIPLLMREHSTLQFEILTPEQMLMGEETLEALLQRLSKKIKSVVGPFQAPHPNTNPAPRPYRTRILVDETMPLYQATEQYIAGGETWELVVLGGEKA